jgi:hypothetical protein
VKRIHAERRSRKGSAKIFKWQHDLGQDNSTLSKPVFQQQSFCRQIILPLISLRVLCELCAFACAFVFFFLVAARPPCAIG